jgi:hypothetical protein
VDRSVRQGGEGQWLDERARGFSHDHIDAGTLLNQEACECRSLVCGNSTCHGEHDLFAL